MRQTLAALMVLGALAGCQGEQAAWQSMTLPTTDLPAAFDAAQQVLAEDYTLARASVSEGRIETRPLMIGKTGSDRKLGAYLSSGDTQMYRRIVVCRIEGGQGGTVVYIAANLQREGTSQAETLLISSEGGDDRQAGAERRWRYLDEKRASYWADIGREREVETDLLGRIREKVSAGP